jgi:hypothetical protein
VVYSRDAVTGALRFHESLAPYSFVRALACTTDSAAFAPRAYVVTRDALVIFEAIPDVPELLGYNDVPANVLQGDSVSWTPVVRAPRDVGEWRVQPALPSGLQLDASTGVISGTVTAGFEARRAYTIEAANHGGRAHAVVFFGVRPLPPQCVYPTTSVTALVETPLSVVPNASGVEKFTIQPHLPAGLLFSEETGA